LTFSTFILSAFFTVKTLLAQQVKIKDLERHAQNETLKQSTINQLDQLVMPEEFKANQQLRAELQTRTEQLAK